MRYISLGVYGKKGHLKEERRSRMILFWRVICSNSHFDAWGSLSSQTSIGINAPYVTPGQE
jgi:hypothetical protein